jgi:hypothetical protein
MGSAVPQPPTNRPDPAWVADFYRESGREVTLSFTHLHTIESWRVTVLVTGAGFILANVVAKGTQLPSIPSLWSLVVITVVWFLYLRLIQRSLLIYGNLDRFNKLQRSTIEWRRQTTPEAWTEFWQRYSDLYLKWRSSLPRWKLVRATFKLDGSYYFVPAILLLSVLNLIQTSKCQPAWYVAIGFVAVTLTEFVLFRRTSYFLQPGETLPWWASGCLYAVIWALAFGAGVWVRLSTGWSPSC